MNDVAYHGSSIGGLKEIKKHRSTHNIEVVYAAGDISVPLAFIRNKNNGDLDFSISISDGKLQIVERREGLLDLVYNTEGYIYVLSAENFVHYDYLWSPELVSDRNETVIQEIFIPCVRDELVKLSEEGKIELYKYPKRPDCMPLDNSDLIEHCSIIAEKYNKTDLIDQMLQIYPEFQDLMNRESNSTEKSRI